MTSCRRTKLASDERPAEAVANEQIRRIVDRYQPMIRFDGVDGEISSCLLASGQPTRSRHAGRIGERPKLKVGIPRHSRRFGLSVTSNESASSVRRKQERTAQKFLTSHVTHEPYTTFVTFC